MTTADDPAAVDDVVRALRAGDVVLVPTDTVYGLAADPTSKRAMGALFDLKGRPDDVPIAVLVASLEQAGQIVERSGSLDRLAGQHWPGPLTIVAPLRGGVELHIGGSGSTVGVRMPDSPFLLEVLALFGPIAATSANEHGRPTIVDAAAARQLWGRRVRTIVDGGRIDGIASTVIELDRDSLSSLTVHRIGAVAPEQLGIQIARSDTDDAKQTQVDDPRGRPCDHWPGGRNPT